MIPAGEDSNLILLHFVDEPVFPIASPGPAALQLVLQGLRFSGAAEGFTLDIANQADDAKGLCPIVFHPPREIFESGGVKLQVSRWRRQA